MEDKTKVLIIVLAVAFAVSLVINMHVHGLKKRLEHERDSLNAENALLTKKIEDTQQKVSVLQGSLDKMALEKKNLESQAEDTKRRYEQAAKERDELNEKLRDEEEASKEQRETLRASLTQDTYWAGILKAKTDLEIELDKLRADLKNAQINNEALDREKSASELELKNLEHEKNSLEQQLDYGQRTLDSITAELVREKNAKRSSQENSRFLKNENIILKQQLKAITGYKINLEKKILALQGEKDNLERKFNEMGAMLEDKYSQMGELKQKVDSIRSIGTGTHAATKVQPPRKESIELPPIVVRPQTEMSGSRSDVPASVEAKVLAINKENNFVIIDMGSNGNIEVGKDFDVYRDGISIASLETIEVRKDISACDIKKESVPIKVGDIVK